MTADDGEQLLVPFRAVLAVLPFVVLLDHGLARVAGRAVDPERLHIEMPADKVIGSGTATVGRPGVGVDVCKADRREGCGARVAHAGDSDIVGVAVVGSSRALLSRDR